MFTPKKIIAEETQRFEDPFGKTKYIYIYLSIYINILCTYLYIEIWPGLGLWHPPWNAS